MDDVIARRPETRHDIYNVYITVAGAGAELGAGQGATWHEDRRLTHRDISSTSEVGQIT